MNRVYHFVFSQLVFLVPLVFFPKTAEIFEFNKMVLVYLFTIIIAALWAQECARQRKFIFRKTPLTMPIIIFLASQALATLFSIDVYTSVFGYYGRFNGGLLSLVSYAILYFAFVTFVSKRQTISIIKTLLVTSLVAGVYAALEHFGASPSCILITGNFDVDCWVQDVQARVFGTFGQPNWLAAWLVAVIPLAWAKATDLQFKICNLQSIFNFKISKHKNIFYLILGFLLYTVLLFTKSRSGILGFLVAYFTFWIPNFKKHFCLFSLTTSYILLATIFIWNPFTPSAAPPVEGVTESGDIRRIVWQGAVDLWKKYPIFGTGVETFAYSYYETRPVAHNNTSEWNFIYNKAHNEYLNFLATTGIIGLASYLFLIFASIKVFLRKLNLVKTALLAGYAGILVTNFFGFSTVTTALLFFLFGAFAEKLK